MALTAAQVRDHAARMLQWGYDHLAPEQRLRAEHCFALLVEFGKDYRLNGSVGTLADRSEAMRTVRKQLLQGLYGHATTEPDWDHYYTNHVIALASPGEEGA